MNPLIRHSRKVSSSAWIFPRDPHHILSKIAYSVFWRVLICSSEKAMAPHSSTLAWKIPWTEEPGRLQSWGCWGSDTTEQLHFHFSLSCTGEGNGNPPPCSCLESPRDGGAWWAAVYGVAQNRTRLKRLSSSSSRLVITLLPRSKCFNCMAPKSIRRFIK